MIEAGVLARFFYGQNVVRLLDDADNFPIARGAGAVQAGVAVGNVVADAALVNIQFGLANGFGKGQGLFRRDAQEMKGQALRGLLPDTRETLEFVEQFDDGFGKIRNEKAFLRVASLRYPSPDEQQIPRPPRGLGKTICPGS